MGGRVNAAVCTTVAVLLMQGLVSCFLAVVFAGGYFFCGQRHELGHDFQQVCLGPTNVSAGVLAVLHGSSPWCGGAFAPAPVFNQPKHSSRVWSEVQRFNRFSLINRIFLLGIVQEALLDL